jgi:hypothetical protein
MESRQAGRARETIIPNRQDSCPSSLPSKPGHYGPDHS